MQIEKNCPFDITPYEISSLVKTPRVKNLNYTNQDFSSIKSRIMEIIKDEFADTFNDFVESDLAIMLIENLAFMTDTLSFKIDQIANEIFIDTVSEVDNAFRLAMLMGYKPQPPICSRALFSASIANTTTTDVLVETPVLIPINTESGLRYIELFAADDRGQPLLNEDIVISAGSFLTTSIVGLEGRTYDQSTSGNGQPNQYVVLSQSPVIWNSIQVKVNGVYWEQVQYFTDSQPRNEYRVEYDPSYRAYIMFGNSRGGQIPSLGSQIEISYRVGGGLAGNIVTGSVDIQRNYIVPGFDFRIPVTFRNYTKGEYGYEGDSIEDIKRKMPRWLRTQNRVVSGDDIETFAEQFSTEFNGQIGKAKATLRNYGCAANIIDLYVLAKDGANQLDYASDTLKVELQEALEDKKTINSVICIKDGTIVEVDANIDVTLDKFYRKFEDEIRERIHRRIDNFFSLNNWDYGQALKSVDIIKSFSDIPEVRNVELNLQTVDPNNSGSVVTTRFYEIIRPSLISISFVYE